MPRPPAYLGPLRQFTLASSYYPNQAVQAASCTAVCVCLRWRNQNARHPDALAARRRERARVRSEKGIRLGGSPHRRTGLTVLPNSRPLGGKSRTSGHQKIHHVGLFHHLVGEELTQSAALFGEKGTPVVLGKDKER